MYHPWEISHSPAHVSSAFHPKSSRPIFGWCCRGNIASVGWQVKLRDPIGYDTRVPVLLKRVWTNFHKCDSTCHALRNLMCWQTVCCWEAALPRIRCAIKSTAVCEHVFRIYGPQLCLHSDCSVAAGIWNTPRSYTRGHLWSACSQCII